MSQNFVKYGQSGLTIIFLLGANTLPHYLEKFFNLIAEKYTVYAIFYPGLGNSIKIVKHSEEAYLEYLQKVIYDEINPSEYILAGFSFGGFLACKFTQKDKTNKIKQLLLFSPETRLKTNSTLSLAWRFLVTEIHNRTQPKDNWIGRSIFAPFERKYIPAMKLHSQLTRQSFLQPQDIPAIKKLVLIGMKDLIVDSRYTEELFRKDPNCNLVKYDNLGHDAFSTIGRKILDIIDREIK